MLRARIEATPDTDVELEIERLHALCRSSRIPAPEVDRILTDVRVTLTELIPRGRQLSAIGSTMSISRTIAADSCEVLLLFSVGLRKGFFERLLDFVRGR